MAAIRLRADHRDLSGAVSTLFIYDRELEFNQDNIVLCTSDFYKLKHEGDVNDPFKVIIPCNCQFTIFLSHPNYTEAEQDEVNLFFNDLITSHEGRFYVRCQYGEELGEIEQEFYGKILPDIGELTLDYWQTVEITAIDGITGLRDVEYRPTGYSDTDPEDAVLVTTFKDHFVDIITRNDVVQFFQDTTAAFNTSMVTTSFFWEESQQDTGDLCTQLKVRNIWFEKVGATYRKYKSCYEVLQDLLRGFVARCIYAQGKYHIEQLPYQDNLTLVRYGYKYNGDPMAGVTYGNKTTKNYTTDDNIQSSQSPVKKWLAPFKAVELENSKSFTNYMNGMDISATKTGWGGSGNLNYGNVIAQGNKLVTQWNIEIFNATGYSSLPYLSVRDIEYRLTFKIRIGSYYARIQNSQQFLSVSPNGQYHVSSGGQIPVLEWSTDDSTIELRWNRTFVTQNLTDFQNQNTAWRELIKNADLVLETLEIQADGELQFELIQFLSYSLGTEIAGSPPASLQFRRTSRMIIASGYSDLYEQPKGVKKYEVGDVRNTLIYKTELKYFDSNKDHFEQLFINNTLTSDVNTPTVEWTDPDASQTYPIQDLMMKTLLAMRQYPAETFKMDFFFLEKDIFRMDMRMAINGSLYIPLDLEIYRGTGIYKATFYKVYLDFTGVNIVDIDDPEPEQPYPVPDGGLDYMYPGAPGGGGLQYWEEWENVSTNYVEVDTLLTLVYGMTEDDIKKKVFVFINGVRQRYLDDTLVNRTYKFDTGTNRIYFFKGSGNVSHIEFFRYF